MEQTTNVDPLTRWLVTNAVPLLEVIESGSFPGYELGVCNDSVVLDGEVKCTRSRGKGTNLWFESSMTQLPKRPSLALYTVTKG